MINLSDAVARYHDALGEDGVAAAAADRQNEMLRREGLFFGDRALCAVLRPRFMTPEEYRGIARACSLVGGAFEAVRKAAMTDAALRAQFGLTDWEEQLIHDDPGFAAASPTSRLDAFFVPNQPTGKGGQGTTASPVAGLRFTEYNAETPAGGGYNDALSHVFLMSPAMPAFSKHFSALPIPAGPPTVLAVLGAYQQWSAGRAARQPEVCILDWNDVPTASEFYLYEREFKSLGMSAFIGDPRDAEYRGGTLYVAGKPVTLIYKRVLIDELVTREGLDSPVVRAVRDNAVCMVNPFRCKMLHKKASLAVVSDELQAHLLTAEQQAAVAMHIPWTRVVTERRTRYQEENIDLIPWIAANRERLVLKPNDDYGGKGIVLGWTVSSEVWEASVQTALDSPFIVQERVEIPSEPWPTVVDGALHISDRMLDTAPFMSNGTMVQGCLTRIATDPLLNVTSGGGSNVPTFLVEPR